jgi:phospholipid N-methyltransferase
MASIPLKTKGNSATFLNRSRRFLRQWGMFARQFARHPGMIGSIIPSSPMLVDAMLDDVDWHTTRLFVEYGPGVGTFTRPILERMHADATLLAIDLNLDFIAFLEEDIADPRLRTAHGSAADVRRFIAEAGLGQADYILSGLPFSTLPAGVAETITAETGAALRPGGQFLVYQYSRFVGRFLAPVFDRVDEAVEWLNIPPCRIFRARMDAPAQTSRTA